MNTRQTAEDTQADQGKDRKTNSHEDGTSLE
jgi:hypothetical protein